MASKRWPCGQRLAAWSLRSTALCCALSCAVDRAGPVARVDDDFDPSHAVALTEGPVLGAITDRSVKVWARFDGATPFSVDYWAVDTPQQKSRSATVLATPEQGFTAALTLEGLRPETEYEYEIAVAPNALSDASIALATGARFRTLPEAGQPGVIRFATGADVNPPDHRGFEDLASLALDFVLLLGDTPYADSAETNDMRGYQAVYSALWSTPAVIDLFAQTPVFMTWDDHEIMENYWSGKDDQRYALGRTLFDRYQGAHNPAPLHEGEIYYSFEAADVGFFVLDTRTHRSDNLEPDGATKTMLGARQRAALEEWLIEDRYAAHVIVSSVLFGDFSTTGKDAWSSFTTERDAIFDVIAESKTRNAIVISGDQHWSAVIENAHDATAPYTLFEFQATPLGTSERDAPSKRDASLLALDNTHLVFGVFAIDTTVDPIALTYTLCAASEPCSPDEEPPPIAPGETTLSQLPYTLALRSGAHGFERALP